MNGTLVLSRGADASRREVEDRLLGRAVAAGADVWLVGHLYHLPEDCSLWAELALAPGPLALASWLAPRPAMALLTRHGLWSAGSVAVALDADPEESWQRLSGVLGTLSAPGRVLPREGEGKDAAPARWYPLVDAEKCSQCHHCLQFCLFGVYGLDGRGEVVVSHPDRCKAGCPACSRICPQGAIMFPLYAKDPAIAGAPGTAMQLDTAGKALFFNRTRQPCPLCGFSGARDPSHAGEPCAACGRHTRPPAAPPRPADAIDALLDDLERLQERRG